MRGTEIFSAEECLWHPVILSKRAVIFNKMNNNRINVHIIFVFKTGKKHKWILVLFSLGKIL